MKHFFRGGRGLPIGQSDTLSQISRHYDQNVMERSNPAGLIGDNLFDRLLRPLGRSRSDEDRKSLCTTFGMASPLLRPYITDSSRIQHRFNASESRIVDEKVIKRCSGGNKTPKLVRSRYESDQEPVGHQDYQLSSSQVLPLFCLCSTSPRSGRDRAVTWLRSFIGASSQTHHSAIEAPSENGRTRLGPGRDLVGSFSAYPLPRGRSFSGLEPSGYQRTGKEQADKYQAKPKASPEMEQRSTKEQAENKQRVSRRDLAHTWGILRPCTNGTDSVGIRRGYSKDIVLFVQQLRRISGVLKGYFEAASAQPDHSTTQARSIGMASRLGLTISEASSTAVRQLFESCSAVSRRIVEGESNSTRRSVEAVPNTSRSVVKDFPKSSRTIAETEGARTKVELALTQPKTKVELGMNYQTTKDELATSLARTNVELAKEVPERYCKGTGKVLKSGGKGTGEVLESYQIGTKELHADGRSVVGYDGDGGKLEKGGGAISFVSDVFKRLCGVRIVKDVSLGVKRKTRRLRGLNRAVRRCVAFRPVGNRNEMETSNLKGLIVDNLRSRLLRQARSDGRIKLSRYDDIKRPKAYSLQLMTLLCVLFSSLVGVQAVAQVQSGSSLVGVVSSAVDGRTIGGTGAQGSHRPYDFSFYGAVEVRLLTRTQQVEGEKRRYPKVDFNKFPIEIFKVDADRIPKLQVGQLLPDAVLDMPLRVVNDVYGRDTVTLRSCMDRRWIILDIWSESCIPCLASMNHWEELSKTDQSFTLLGVYHSFYTHRAMPETRKKDYRSTQIIGPATAILSRLFLQAKGRLGPTVWIKDGRFFGVSEANTLRDEDYRLLLDGKLNAIPEYALWKPITY